VVQRDGEIDMTTKYEIIRGDDHLVNKKCEDCSYKLDLLSCNNPMVMERYVNCKRLNRKQIKKLKHVPLQWARHNCRILNPYLKAV